MIPLLYLPVGLLVLLADPSFADFSYNPTRLFITNNGSWAYIFTSQQPTSQVELQFLNISDSLDTSTPSLSTLTTNLPFLSSSSPRAYTPILNADELNVLTGSCNDASKSTELWRFTTDNEDIFGTWDKLSLSAKDSTIDSNFLAAGLSFSPTASLRDASLYLFGGMCPGQNSTEEDWVSSGVYSNDMLSVSPDAYSPDSSQKPAYESFIIPSRGPPVAEAGLTITPLTPTYPNTSSTSASQQQNFVLLGGHTQRAFINMSQVALFSLPQQIWSFQAIGPADSGKTDLMARSSTPEVEPRSGHTAVLTPDGSKIIVFGGWVGDISTPAEPQLAVLEVGRGYGGIGDWIWTVPSTTTNPFQPGEGVYGHGAAMLEGGVMLVTGGYRISATSSKSRRQNVQTSNSQMLLFNITSTAFVTTYTNPASLRSAGDVENKPGTGALRTTSQKVGLGAGLVLGFLAIAGAFAVYIFYSRRLRQKRALREKELRELALGAERYYSGDVIGGGVDGPGGQYPEMRSASWGSRQEKRISGRSDDFPWAPVANAGVERTGEIGACGNGEREAERTGLLIDIPSPTRGLRKALHSRGPTSYSPNNGAPSTSPFGPPSATGGEIHTITEQDEESEASGSLRRPKSSKSRRGNIRPESGSSDPFKDPPPLLTRSQSDLDRLHREREVKGWVDDWEAAGAAMESGRTPQNSSKQDPKQGHSNDSRSESPEKSDRTNSNLSEWSTLSSSSIQRSLFGSISRNVSMRSASAGYMLFANAAAAMTGRATLIHHPGPGPGPGPSDGNTGTARASSKRSVSLNLNSTTSTRNKAGSQKERSDTFSTARTSFGPSQPSENEALLPNGAPTRQGNEEVFETPPESPIRERQATASSGRKALGWMGSMRRALTGTGGPDHNGVRRRVEEYEQRHGNANPTIEDPTPQMVEVNSSPRRAASASAAFWRGKKGAKDWDAVPSLDVAGLANVAPASSSSSSDRKTPAPAPRRGTVIRRKPVPGREAEASMEQSPGGEEAAAEEEDDEWDVEAAVQKRLVQVMFTVPKEKLRVVNVDSLSLLSKSDGDPGEGSGEAEREREREREEAMAKRVSTVVEDVEESESPIRSGVATARGTENRALDTKWKGKGKEMEEDKI